MSVQLLVNCFGRFGLLGVPGTSQLVNTGRQHRIRWLKSNSSHSRGEGQASTIKLGQRLEHLQAAFFGGS